MTVAERLSCVRARFWIDFHTIPVQRYSQPTPTSLFQAVYLFRCNLPLALLPEWPGSFTYHCGNRGVEQTPNKSHHAKLTLKKKILLLLLPGFEFATFWSWVWHSYQQAVPALPLCISIKMSPWPRTNPRTRTLLFDFYVCLKRGPIIVIIIICKLCHLTCCGACMYVCMCVWLCVWVCVCVCV